MLETSNPLKDFISDETYEAIKPFLNENAVRNYQIRNKFKELRKEGVSAGDAVEKIMEIYPYLQFDTVRKLVYEVKNKKKPSSNNAVYHV